MRAKLSKNKKGITPTVSTMMMMAITVLAMLLVISFSQTIINARSSQMGENLFVERVFFDSTHIRIFVSNIGHGDLTLEYAIINGEIHSLTEGKVTLQNEERLFVYIEDYTVDPQGIYHISFISSRGKELGVTEVEYP